MLKTTTVALTLPATDPRVGGWLAAELAAAGLTLVHLAPVTLLVTVTPARLPPGADPAAWVDAALRRVVGVGKVRKVRGGGA